MSARHEERGGTDTEEVASLHGIEPSLSLDGRGLFEDMGVKVRLLAKSPSGPRDSLSGSRGCNFQDWRIWPLRHSTSAGPGRVRSKRNRETGPNSCERASQYGRTAPVLATSRFPFIFATDFRNMQGPMFMGPERCCKTYPLWNAGKALTPCQLI
jgi:hypothetical protein